MILYINTTYSTSKLVYKFTACGIIRIINRCLADLAVTDGHIPCGEPHDASRIKVRLCSTRPSGIGGTHFDIGNSAVINYNIFIINHGIDAPHCRTGVNISRNKSLTVCAHMGKLVRSILYIQIRDNDITSTGTTEEATTIGLILTHTTCREILDGMSISIEAAGFCSIQIIIMDWDNLLTIQVDILCDNIIALLEQFSILTLPGVFCVLQSLGEGNQVLGRGDFVEVARHRRTVNCDRSILTSEQWLLVRPVDFGHCVAETSTGDTFVAVFTFRMIFRRICMSDVCGVFVGYPIGTHRLIIHLDGKRAGIIAHRENRYLEIFVFAGNLILVRKIQGNHIT